MASLVFDVDTTPLANTVNSVKGHVNATTAAVTTMEAAVIATERQASKTICENVDTGFYVMIKSQISQKAVAAYSEMTTRQMTLFQLVKALDNVRKQMEADFNMISKRYNKLFQSLNKALETRVKEIDRPAMHLAEIKKTLVFDKLKDTASLVLSASNESPFTVQTALAGKLKQKAKHTMQILARTVVEGQSYNGKVESILESRDPAHFHGEGNSGICFLPGIVASSMSFLNSNDSIDSVYIAQAPYWQNTTALVAAITTEKENFKWMPSSDNEREGVKREFNNLCENENLEERIGKEMKRLFEQSHWEAAAPQGAGT